MGAFLEAELSRIRGRFPRFRIVPKRASPFSFALDRALRVVTLGGQREYLTHYHTVIGATLYVPDVWDHMSDTARVILLRHEVVHLEQFQRYGRVGMAFLYLVPFFPVGLAYGRACLEWEAYRATLAATAALQGLEAARALELRQEIVTRFTGPAYGWMWPFRAHVERWYDAALAELERRVTSNAEPPPPEKPA